VHVTAALARTANVDAARCDEKLNDASGDELKLAPRSANTVRLDGPVKSGLHAAASSAANDATTVCQPSVGLQQARFLLRVRVDMGAFQNPCGRQPTGSPRARTGRHTGGRAHASPPAVKAT